MSVATWFPQFLSILRADVATCFAGICEVFFTVKLNVDSIGGFEIFNVDSIALTSISRVREHDSASPDDFPLRDAHHECHLRP